MSYSLKAFYNFAVESVEKFWKEVKDIKSSTYTVNDISEKKVEVSNFPEKVIVELSNNKVDTGITIPEQNDYTEHFNNLSALLAEIIKDVELSNSTLDSKDMSPRVEFNYDDSKLVGSVEKMANKLDNIKPTKIEMEKLKGTDAKSYVPVRLTDGEQFYKAMALGGGGNHVDPLASYKIHENDDGHLDYNYYGYVKTNGRWYIMREDVVGKRYRYANGTSDFASNYTNRTLLTYKYANELSW